MQGKLQSSLKSGTESSLENLPEEIVVFEKGADGILRKKRKRLIKVLRKDELTEVQKREIESAFTLFDADGSDNIDVFELRDAMRALGLNMTKDQVKEMMATIDTEGNGFIDKEEFMDLMKVKIKDRNLKEELKKAFRIYD